MINKKSFLKAIDKYQDEVVEHILTQPTNFILVKGAKFIGKTTTVYKIFEREHDCPIIYHTGCNPKKMDIANKHFLFVLEQFKNTPCIVLLDEYYHPQIVEYLSSNKNFKSILFVNYQDLFIEGSYEFYMNKAFEQCKEKFFKNYNKFEWKQKNIREINYLFEHQKNFNEQDFILTQKNNEIKRQSSSVTQVRVKQDDSVIIYSIDFYD